MKKNFDLALCRSGHQFLLPSCTCLFCRFFKCTFASHCLFNLCSLYLVCLSFVCFCIYVCFVHLKICLAYLRFALQRIFLRASCASMCVSFSIPRVHGVS